MRRTTASTMRGTIPVLVGVLGALFGLQEWVLAQVRSTTQQTMFGSRTLGGFPTAGTRTFSGSSLGGSSLSGFGSSSLGRTGSLGSLGTGSLGRSGLGSSTGTLQLTGSERFMRGARQPGQFVGADTQDVSGILSSLGSSTRMMSNQNLNFNARAITGQGRSRVNQPGSQPGGAGGRTSRGTRSGEQLAVAVQLGFEPPAASGPQVLSSSLTAKIGHSKRIQALQPIQVLLSEDGTAVLKGVVATPHDRELAAQWVLLEPGVRSVRNELEVGQTSPGSAGSGAVQKP